MCVRAFDNLAISLQWGYIGETPGASLQFVINTVLEGMETEGKDHAALTMSYLQSYEHMGKAGACYGWRYLMVLLIV